MKNDLQNVLSRIDDFPDSINKKALWHTIKFAISLAELVESSDRGKNKNP